MRKSKQTTSCRRTTPISNMGNRTCAVLRPNAGFPACFRCLKRYVEKLMLTNRSAVEPHQIIETIRNQFPGTHPQEIVQSRKVVLVP